MPGPVTSTSYPAAQRLDLVEELPAAHPAHRVADPYRWLEDAADPRTQEWSQAQDELVEAHRGRWAGRERLAGRIRELLSAGTVGPPVWRGERRFLVRRTGEQEHGVLLVIEPDGAGGERERVLVDPMAVDPSGATTLDAWQPSKEGHLLAYQLSEGGTEESVLRVMDVATGGLVDGPLDRARYSPIAWLPGGERFYYVRRLDPAGLPEDERQYHRRVWLHTVGADPDTDVEVFGAGRAMTSYYGVGVSLDGRWLTVSAAEGTAPRTDVWLADLQASSPEQPVLAEVAVGLDAHTGAHVGRDGRLYVATDLDAPRGRLAVADPQAPRPERWRDLLPERADAVLEDYAVLDGEQLGDSPVLLAGWTTHAVSEVTVHDLVTGEQRGRLELPGLGTVGGLLSRPEGGHEAWFSYTDHTTLPHVYRYDARTGEVSLWSTPPGAIEEVPDVVARQIEVTSADSTTVRMFVVARADAVGEDGSPLAPAPTILYGYGGFGVSLTPGYSATALAWVEAGGVYVVANLRGGSEEGETWHRDGMRAVKQHTFDDFAACADALVAGGWTTPAQLSVSGGSNGGLLVGAALTQRPEAYAAVVCAAPLLDMVRYQRHGLGITWTEEYGDAEDPEELGWLLGYSPYHAVREGVRYPATLFTVFDGDTRVDPLHARKLAAALQHASSAGPDEAPVLVRREKDVGHGARAISRTVDLVADTLAFTAHHTGLDLT
jgi:prolyl oligopeptidase